LCSAASIDTSNRTLDLVGVEAVDVAMIVIWRMNQVGGANESSGPATGAGKNDSGSEGKYCICILPSVVSSSRLACVNLFSFLAAAAISSLFGTFGSTPTDAANRTFFWLGSGPSPSACESRVSGACSSASAPFRLRIGLALRSLGLVHLFHLGLGWGRSDSFLS
jgi:hypothetical protein